MRRARLLLRAPLDWLGVAAFGVLACVMALSAEAVYTLVEQSSAFGSAGIVVTVTFGLFTRLGGARSALAALLAGVGVWVVGNYVLGLSWAYLAAVGASVAAYAAGAFFERGAVTWSVADRSRASP